MGSIASTPELVAGVYSRTRQNLEVIRGRLGKPLTLAEKILLGHADNATVQKIDRGKAYLNLRPDRVAMQDATAQMALLQFMMAGKEEATVPSTVHCDHLLRGHKGAENDLAVAQEENA